MYYVGFLQFHKTCFYHVHTQGCHGRFLAGKKATVAATSLACCCCYHRFLFLKIQPRTKPWLPCLLWRTWYISWNICKVIAYQAMHLLWITSLFARLKNPKEAKGKTEVPHLCAKKQTFLCLLLFSSFSSSLFIHGSGINLVKLPPYSCFVYLLTRPALDSSVKTF